MIYLASLSDVKKIPDNTTKLLIARIPIDNEKKYGIHHVPNLSPSSELLWDIKKHEITWKEYVIRFREELTKSNAQLALQKIEDYLYKTNKNIALICYCKSEKHCHRMIVGNYFKEIGYGVTSIEN